VEQGASTHCQSPEAPHIALTEFVDRGPQGYEQLAVAVHEVPAFGIKAGQFAPGVGAGLHTQVDDVAPRQVHSAPLE
jgi:hypothetical protein